MPNARTGKRLLSRLSQNTTSTSEDSFELLNLQRNKRQSPNPYANSNGNDNDSVDQQQEQPQKKKPKTQGKTKEVQLATILTDFAEAVNELYQLLEYASIVAWKPNEFSENNPQQLLREHYKAFCDDNNYRIKWNDEIEDDTSIKSLPLRFQRKKLTERENALQNMYPFRKEVFTLQKQMEENRYISKKPEINQKLNLDPQQQRQQGQQEQQEQQQEQLPGKLKSTTTNNKTNTSKKVVKKVESPPKSNDKLKSKPKSKHKPTLRAREIESSEIKEIEKNEKITEIDVATKESTDDKLVEHSDDEEGLKVHEEQIEEEEEEEEEEGEEEEEEEEKSDQSPNPHGVFHNNSKKVSVSLTVPSLLITHPSHIPGWQPQPQDQMQTDIAATERDLQHLDYQPQTIRVTNLNNAQREVTSSLSQRLSTFLENRYKTPIIDEANAIDFAYTKEEYDEINKQQQKMFKDIYNKIYAENTLVFTNQKIERRKIVLPPSSSNFKLNDPFRNANAVSPKLPGTSNNMTFQDHLVAQGASFSRIHHQMRKQHINRARKVALIVDQHFKRKRGEKERLQRERELSLKKLSRTVMQAVKRRWNEAAKVYSIIQSEKDEELKKIKGREHLSQMLEHSTQLLEAQLISSREQTADAESNFDNSEMLPLSDDFDASKDSDDYLSSSDSDDDNENNDYEGAKPLSKMSSNQNLTEISSTDDNDFNLSVDELRKKYAGIEGSMEAAELSEIKTNDIKMKDLEDDDKNGINTKNGSQELITNSESETTALSIKNGKMSGKTLINETEDNLGSEVDNDSSDADAKPVSSLISLLGGGMEDSDDDDDDDDAELDSVYSSSDEEMSTSGDDDDDEEEEEEEKEEEEETEEKQKQKEKEVESEKDTEVGVEEEVNGESKANDRETPISNGHVDDTHKESEEDTGAVEIINGAKVKDVPVPQLLRGTLRPYQKQGLNWLASLYNNNTNGILADEMGLGKTIQTISLLAYLACEHHVWGPHLIVVPTSVMLNWDMEFKKFAPGFKVLTYYGSPQQRAQKRKGWFKPDAFHVCITSYQLVVQDQQAFKRKKWRYMILDEAHNIKNFRSTRWRALLNFNTENRLLLTGTPLQNNLMELWSLLYFLMPSSKANMAMPEGFANLEDFQQWFGKPVDKILEQTTLTNNADLIDENEKTTSKMDEETRNTVSRLHQVLRPYILRRLKKDVEKQMPGKYEHIVYCRLSKRQRYLYDDFMSRAKTKETLMSGNFLSIINCLMQLRKVCNHPDLFEVRPIVTSFAMPEAVSSTYLAINSVVQNWTNGNAMDRVDLKVLNLDITRHENLDYFVADSASKLVSITDFEKQIAQLKSVSSEVNTFENPHYVKSYQQLKALDQIEARDKIQHVSYINKLRCNRKPIYGKSLLNKLKIVKPVDSNDTSIQLGITVSQRAELMTDAIEKFSILTPAVVTLDLNNQMFSKSLQDRVHSEVLDGKILNPFHQSQAKLSIAFPDKTLLQYDCGKLQKLATLMRDLVANGHRALIFTQMTKVLDILEQFLNIHGYRYMRLDGATKIEDRQLLTEKFNRDPKIPVFILSTRSGGLGINLTGADTVIFYDSDWNPAMDKQCQDRCHRIGQVRDVHIYRFVSEYTIESNIIKKANQKRQLDNVVIQEGEFTTDYFGKFSVRDLVSDSNVTDIAERTIDFSGDSKMGSVLAQAEDEEDRAAAGAAMKEVAVDDEDFTEDANGRRENSDLALNTATANDEGDADMDLDYDEGIGHIDEYMLRFISEGYL